MTEEVVVAYSLCKHFEIDSVVVRALNSVNLRVKSGEFICLYGPSGSGKTTLLNIIGGLEKTTSGSISVFGNNLGNYTEDFLATFRATHIGFVFQSYNLISTLTAKENITFAMELAGWKSHQIDERSEALLKMVGLEQRKIHFPTQLSGVNDKEYPLRVH